MHKATREAAELKRQLEPYLELEQAMQRDAGLREALNQAYTGYYEDGSAGVATPAPQANPAFDANARFQWDERRRIDQLEFKTNLSELEAEVGKLSQEQRDELEVLSRARGTNDLKFLYYGKFGPTLVGKAHEAGAKDAAKAIAANNGAYSPRPATSSGPSVTPDRSKMSPAEQEAYDLKVTQDILNKNIPEHLR